MSLYISSSLVLSDPVGDGYVIDGNNPVIGYKTILEFGAFTSTTAATGLPVSHLASNSTYDRWEGTDDSSDEYITFTVAEDTQPADYVGIARHNFATGQISVSLEIFNGSTWDEEVAPFIPPDDGPILIRFTNQEIEAIRIRLQPTGVIPTAAVVFIGELLVIQRRLYVGHTPITMGRKTRVSNGRSENGQFLGRIILSDIVSTKVDLTNLIPDWYRENMEPFAIAAKEVPFFFAWRPEDYRFEVGYVWLTQDLTPVNARVNGLMSVSMEISGVA